MGGKLNEETNMSIRKLLKQVGVTSQQAIEEALRNAGETSGRTYQAKLVLTIEALDLNHEVTGEIKG